MLSVADVTDVARPLSHFQVPADFIRCSHPAQSLRLFASADFELIPRVHGSNTVLVPACIGLE